MNKSCSVLLAPAALFLASPSDPTMINTQELAACLAEKGNKITAGEATINIETKKNTVRVTMTLGPQTDDSFLEIFTYPQQETDPEELDKMIDANKEIPMEYDLRVGKNQQSELEEFAELDGINQRYPLAVAQVLRKACPKV